MVRVQPCDFQTNRVVLMMKHTGFGGPSTEKGNTGPFWIGSGLAILSAIVTFVLVKPLTHDGMKAEDEAVSLTFWT